jgi:hypothetical protein
VNDELERTLKASVMSYFKILPQHVLEIEETHENPHSR